MYSMKQEAKKRKDPRKNIAFYISLAVCIAAVAGAAWSVYGSVNDYVAPVREVPSQESRVTPESSAHVKTEESSAEERKPVVRDTAVKETSQPAGAVDAKPVGETEEPSAAPVAAEPSKPEVCRPADGDVIRPFSPQVPIYSQTMKDYRTHSGIDISAGEGTTVKAAMNGKVKRIYSDPMLGKVICIEHEGGYEAFYCGLTDSPAVSEGDTVEAGGTIGYIGTVPSEKADEPHLHLELRYSGSIIDPGIII